MRHQAMMFDVFREEHRWQDILGVSTVGELNRAILSDHTNDIVAVSEALQEKKISRIADHIAAHPHIKVVLIAGPSSSGKTTFAKRLCVQLMACGKIPYYHDGSVPTLDKAIDMMARYQVGREMPAADVQKVQSFLQALTGELKGKPVTNDNKQQ